MEKRTLKDIDRIARKGSSFYFFLIILFTILGILLGVGTPIITEKLYSDWLVNRMVKEIVFALSGLGLLVLLKVASVYVLRYYGSSMQNKIEYNVRKESFKHFGRLKVEYVDKKNEGHFMVRINDDSYMVSQLYSQVVESMVSGLLTLSVTLTYLFIYDVYLGLILSAVAIIIVISPLFVKNSFFKSFAHVTKEEEAVKSVLANSISGLKESKINNAEEKELAKYDKSLQSLRKTYARNYSLQAGFTFFDIFMNGMISIVIFAIGAWQIYEGNMSIAQLVSATMFGNALVEPIRKFFMIFDVIMSSMSSWRRVLDFWNVPTEDYETGGLFTSKVSGDIEFKDVKFEYVLDGSDQLSPDEEWFKYLTKEQKEATPDQITRVKAVDGISLKIKAGQKVAFVGETGSGKSTLFKMLLRFYDPTSGQVLIDGQDISKINVGQIREQISYLQQEPYLFYDSIKNNVVFAIEDYESMPSDELDSKFKKALKISQSSKFVDELTNKENQVIGPRGIMLSGGQKQRIAIARVVLKESPILLFDEATSALDNETEKEIQKSVEEISANKTTIYIAHRLTTIHKLDKIFVFKKGKLVEEGTHSELLKAKGYYYSLNKAALHDEGGENV